MRAARYCSTGVWIEREFIGLSATAQRVFYAAWTAPETQTCGITTIGAAALASRLRLPINDIDAALLELVNADRISTDPKFALIWLHGFLETQLGGLPVKSEAWMRSSVSAVGSLPDCDLTRRFRVHYGLTDSDEGRVSTGRAPRVDGVVESAPLPDPISLSSLKTGDAKKTLKNSRGWS